MQLGNHTFGPDQYSLGYQRYYCTSLVFRSLQVDKLLSGRQGDPSFTIYTRTYHLDPPVY